MKKLIVSLLLILLLTNTVTASEELVWKETQQVTISSGTKSVSIVWTDLTDERVRVEAESANLKIGEAIPLEALVEQSTNTDGTAVAGINGTFFAAYTDLQPLGSLIIDGDVRHISTSGSVFALDDQNHVNIGYIKTEIRIGSNGQWVWPYTWTAWNINHFYEDTAATMIFNAHYNGVKPVHSFTAIVVDKGIVTKKVVGGFEIPTEGFTILTNEQTIIEQMQIGNKAAYRFEYFTEDYNPATAKAETDAYDNVRTAVGAGPLLVKAGKIVLDGQLEGFSEDKILKESAARSMIGVTKENRLGMVTVSSATLNELAEIAVKLGFIEAMNLDGGGSSGLYYKNSYITEPGRDLSNAIVIKILDKTPIKVTLNGKPIFFDVDPYLDPSVSRTLVPLRKIAEALGATVGWDPETSSILITRNDIQLSLKTGSNIVYVNGEKRTMDVLVIIRDSRSFVPLRFITEYFGGDVKWDELTKTARLTIDDVQDLIRAGDAAYAAKDYTQAIIAYEEVLKMDDKNLAALKQLAKIYNVHLKQYVDALPYYKKVFELDKGDKENLNSLAWVNYSLAQLDAAIEMFTLYSTSYSNEPGGFYGLGHCYSHYQIQDSETAISYYNMAIERGLAGAGYDYAVKYISTHE